MYRACVVVLSDREYTGEEQDSVGRKLESYIKNNKIEVIVYKIIPEVKSIYKDFIIKCCDNYCVDLVVTIGNKGLAEEVAEEISNDENKKLNSYRRKATILKNLKKENLSVDNELKELVESIKGV